MKKITANSVKLFLFIMLAMNLAGNAQTLMPLPVQSNPYTGNTRGYWFESPVDFLMVGVRVPTTASTDDQSIAVVRFNSSAPPTFPTTTNDFTVLALFQDVPGNNVLAVNIPVYEGDFIGILGSRGPSSTNSYGAGNFSTNILGEPVTLLRLGMQYNLESTNPQNLWYENSSLSRVEMYYSTLVIDDYPYCNDFEDDDGSWSVAGTFPTWEWGEPNNSFISNAASGDNAWVTDLDGDHANNELSFVQSMQFDLTSLVDPMVRFQTIRELQSNVDGVVFQVSTDSGFFWNTLGSAASPSPWYNSASVSSLAALGSSAGWTGSSSGWVDMRHSLSAYETDTNVLFRFAISANATISNEGFGFDHFIIAESNDISLNALLYEDSICGASNQTIDAVICNKSIEDRYDFDIIVDTNGSQFTISYPDTIPVCGCDTFNILTFDGSEGGYWSFEVEIDNSGDVNFSNDTLSGDILLYAIPGGAIVDGGGSYCTGQAIELTFNFSGLGPWDCIYTNGTTNFNVGNVTSPYTAIATTGGNYQIISLSDASGCSGDSGTFGGTTSVVVNPNPTPNLGPDTTICGSYVLDAGAGSTYAWSNGATTQSIVVVSPGLYSVTVTDANGCEGSDEADLDVNPLPNITIDDTVLCEGGTFFFNAGGPFISYLWDDGSTGQIRVVSTVTSVSVTVTDFNGCSNSKTAAITEIVDNPSPNIANAEGLAPVVLDAGAGYLAYFWNTGQQTQTLSVFAPGNYTCTVTDFNGCKGSDVASVKIWPNSIEDVVNAQGVAVYPNPAKDHVTLRFSQEVNLPSQVTLIDMNGRVVGTMKLRPGQYEQQLVLPEGIAAGSYWLNVPVDGGIKQLELIIYH